MSFSSYGNGGGGDNTDISLFEFRENSLYYVNLYLLEMYCPSYQITNRAWMNESEVFSVFNSMLGFQKTKESVDKFIDLILNKLIYKFIKIYLINVSSIKQENIFFYTQHSNLATPVLFFLPEQINLSIYVNLYALNKILREYIMNLSLHELPFSHNFVVNNDDTAASDGSNNDGVGGGGYETSTTTTTALLLKAADNRKRKAYVLDSITALNTSPSPSSSSSRSVSAARGRNQKLPELDDIINLKNQRLGRRKLLQNQQEFNMYGKNPNTRYSDLVYHIVYMSGIQNTNIVFYVLIFLHMLFERAFDDLCKNRNSNYKNIFPISMVVGKEAYVKHSLALDKNEIYRQAKVRNLTPQTLY